jgi:hypothetical protein
VPWGVVASVVVGAYTADQQKKAGEKAAGAQEKGADQAIAEQRRQYDQTREDQMPWLQAGQWAIPRYQDTLNGNYTDFFNSPDYLATQQQGVKAMDMSAASRGGLFGGGHSADLTKYGNQLGAQQLGNYRNALGTLAGFGQNSANALGQFGANTANQISNQYGNIANARASSYGNAADANSQFAAGVGGAFNNWYQQNSANNGGGTGWYLGNNPGRG